MLWLSQVKYPDTWTSTTYLPCLNAVMVYPVVYIWSLFPLQLIFKVNYCKDHKWARSQHFAAYQKYVTWSALKGLKTNHYDYQCHYHLHVHYKYVEQTVLHDTQRRQYTFGNWLTILQWKFRILCELSVDRNIIFQRAQIPENSPSVQARQDRLLGKQQEPLDFVDENGWQIVNIRFWIGRFMKTKTFTLSNLLIFCKL